MQSSRHLGKLRHRQIHEVEPVSVIWRKGVVLRGALGSNASHDVIVRRIPFRSGIMGSGGVLGFYVFTAMKNIIRRSDIPLGFEKPEDRLGHTCGHNLP